MNNSFPTLLSSRHLSSEKNVRFECDGLSFEEYVVRTQSLLREVHAGKNEVEKIVAGNSPFELKPAGDDARGMRKPYKHGVLLIHGLSDSPYHMRHLANFFQRNGFRVMAILLPGHGTQPRDLLDVRWQAWAQAVAFGTECLDAEVDELYLAGFSAGAALSVLQASRDKRVCGLFLFSPALEITARARWANLHKLYSWLVPRAAWASVMPDCDIYKYESFCKNAAAQMYALTQALPKQGINIPVFAAASADDATVHSVATLRFMRQTKHAVKQLIWYSAQKIEDVNIEWVNSFEPTKRILSSAHTAVVVSPGDAHYGAEGEYVNCLHYLVSRDARCETCLDNQQSAWMGEVNQRNLEQGLLRRLMYNPWYVQMEASMRKFIERLP